MKKHHPQLVPFDFEEEEELDNLFEEHSDFSQEQNTSKSNSFKQKFMKKRKLWLILACSIALSLSVIFSFVYLHGHKAVPVQPKAAPKKITEKKTQETPKKKEEPQPKEPKKKEEVKPSPPKPSMPVYTTAPPVEPIRTTPDVVPSSSIPPEAVSTVENNPLPSESNTSKTQAPVSETGVNIVDIDLMPYIGQSIEGVVEALTAQGATVNIHYVEDKTHASGTILDVEGQDTTATFTVAQ